MQKSESYSTERTALWDEMHALLDRLDASEYSLAAARLSSAIDALSEEVINLRVFPAAISRPNIH
jgi:L-rhamnose mutarotase